MKKLLMVDSASEAGDDNTRLSAKHTMGEEAEAGSWWLETLRGTSEELARLALLFQRDAA